MKVKELRKILKNLPADMDVLVNTGLPAEDYTDDAQGYLALPVRKAKTKLQRKTGIYHIAQSRPKKDEKATLSLILE